MFNLIYYVQHAISFEFGREREKWGPKRFKIDFKLLSVHCFTSYIYMCVFHVFFVNKIHKINLLVDMNMNKKTNKKTRDF